MTPTAGSRPARAAFLKFYTGDYTAGTIGFDLEQRGFYTECLFRMWERKGGLPNDERWLARSLQCDPRTVRRLLSFLIDAGKLVVCDGLVTNARMAKEIAEYEVRSSSARDRAKIGLRSPEDRAKITAKKSEREAISRDVASVDVSPRSQKPETREKVTPFSPSGPMPVHVKPVANWSNQFEPTVVDGAILREDGELVLVGQPYRQALEDFGSETRLRIALQQAAAYVKINSPTPLLAQVRSQLAGQLGRKLDQAANHQAAVAAKQQKPLRVCRPGFEGAHA